MKRTCIAAFIGILLPVSHAMGEQTYCSSEEFTFFNCISGSKVMSLCGKSEESSGYLQYRAGQSGGDPELVIPASIDEPKPGKTFIYTTVSNDENMFGKNEVWFRDINNDKSYSLTLVADYDPEGREVPRESVVLKWDGLPAGAPYAFKCDKPDAGFNLEAAESVIGEKTSDNPWTVSPW